MASPAIAHMILRGRVIDSDLIEHSDREGSAFLAPDVKAHLDELALDDPGAMSDLHALTLEEIVAFLAELGSKLDIRKNAHMQEALEWSYDAAPTTPSILAHFYAMLPSFFDPAVTMRMAEECVGVDYLEGWVRKEWPGGGSTAVRAFGSRTLHIVAGNGPLIGAFSLIRSALTRSDCIIKSPSNDPFTSSAIGKTMCEMAPEHPITRHFAVAYWRGGDREVESRLYRPERIEKICAWGGLAALRHVTQYIQPGLELIALDPKRSLSVVGPEAFDGDATMLDVARRIAQDGGTFNQIGCANARVVYVLSGTDGDGVARLNRLGKLVYDELLALPPEISTAPKHYDSELRSMVEAVRLDDEWFNVIGGRDGEGCVIVSQLPEPVAFSEYLADRTLNLVPVDHVDDFVSAVDSFTQTVGVYPNDLLEILRDRLPLYGAQRLVTLGHAIDMARFPLQTPQDAIEPMRRMCKWIVSESFGTESDSGDVGAGAVASSVRGG